MLSQSNDLWVGYEDCISLLQDKAILEFFLLVVRIVLLLRLGID